MHSSSEVRRMPAARHARVGLYLSTEQRNRLKLYAAMLQAQLGRRITHTDAVGHLLDLAGAPEVGHLLDLAGAPEVRHPEPA